MRTFVARQGDHLASIAHASGLDPDVVWNDPRNAPLREAGRAPNLLHEGDVVYLPEAEPRRLPVREGGTHRFKARVPRLTTRARFLRGDRPIADEACTIHVDGRAPVQARSDGDGWVAIEAPVDARAAVVQFERTPVSVELALGHLDPVTTESGVRMRLQLLGYHHGPWHDGPDWVLAAALRNFQRAQGLDLTGEADEATRRALVREAMS